MRKIICLINVIVLIVLCAAAPLYTSHYIPELGMTISLPSQAFVTGRKVPRDFALLEEYSISAAQLEANYKTRDIYLNAVWHDGRADMTEIVVSMTSDDDTRALFDLSAASEKQIKAITDQYLTVSGSDVHRRYDSAAVFKGEQVTFIRAQGISDYDGMRENHLQYMTVVNGSRYTVALIEHYGASVQMTDRSISGENADIMDEVIRSVRFDKVRRRGLAGLNIPIFYIVAAALCLTMLDAYAVYMLIGRLKKKDAQAQAKEQECIE